MIEAGFFCTAHQVRYKVGFDYERADFAPRIAGVIERHARLLRDAQEHSDRRRMAGPTRGVVPGRGADLITPRPSESSIERGPGNRSVRSRSVCRSSAIGDALDGEGENRWSRGGLGNVVTG